MVYQLYKLEFLNNVHFGKNSLNDAEISFSADTLFSALCIEALKSGELKKLYEITQKGGLVISDAFPYQGKTYYLPKPCVRIERTESRGNSSEKKKIKKMKYIPAEKMDSWLSGNFVPDERYDLSRLGKKGVKVSVAVRGKEEPDPYRVKYFSFNEGNGLYFLAGGTEENLNFLEKLMTSLSYSGLGGKRYAGMGRFEYRIAGIPENIQKRLHQKAARYMLLSTALPDEEELPQVMQEADYQLVRRGGFVASETYSEQQMRKKDLYVFAAGSCFGKTFSGNIYDVSSGGKHAVYRYAKGFFMGVDV